MEMAAYERLADRAEDAKEMLDEEVRSYMKDIKVNIKIQENENRKIR